MTTVAAAPISASLAPASDRVASPHSLPPAAPSTAQPPAAKRPRSDRASRSPADDGVTSSAEKARSNGRVSPRTAQTSKVQVKKEPGSPSMPSRPRPKRLDLSSSATSTRGPQTARPSAPLTSRESAGLAIQDVGLACLSPGFQTNNPGMREQLQRSLDVRDQQRLIIEARQKGSKQGGGAPDNDGGPKTQDTTLFGVQTYTPTTSRRKGPPPALSIAAPSASQFASDRVIQSAPLNQTFTGLRPGDQPYTRHAQHGPSGLSQTSHIHHVPATQTENRLPSISDVFGKSDHPYGSNRSPSHPSSQSTAPAAARQPGPASPGQAPNSIVYGNGTILGSRSREFRSAEEAMAKLSGGREDLMPKVVHYGGVQPPTPPSPMPPAGSGNHRTQYATASSHAAHHQGPQTASASVPASRPGIFARTPSMNGRRRGRDEFERDNGSPPSVHSHNATTVSGGHMYAQESRRAAFPGTGYLSTGAGAGAGPAAAGHDTGASFGPTERDAEEDWRANLTGTEKKEEFLRLCERAWDLFHS